ncbi:dephospho-CoA kinase [Candidatus Synechococcus calcipolaris G9]|uniref:Dephospho-CoA kinase n=1 Tax=Candidatus Synechococcus calcipolaris G9 TaxID=1497997 RepID=A0ABT6EW76_9SYNE|nr:dephospho-CoA kinase [Candidatus Synechococcus calcipolaris]MDG2990042.1 dephospho-CoA kinase [Candidatus Synechococcus calcipolaris G9]
MVSQRIIGLTGGIACGKSLGADYLQRTYGLPILDADRLAREAVEPGTWIHGAIIERYGSNIILGDGSLDRRQLAQIIFRDAGERSWLEQLIHPYVGDRLVKLTQAIAEPVIVWVVPLLFEARMTGLVTEIWVVACPESLQRQRLIARDRLSLEDANARIRSQMPLTEKIAQANHVLWNDGEPDALYAAIDQAWHSHH